MLKIFWRIFISCLFISLTSCSGCQKKTPQENIENKVIKKSITIGIAQEPDSLFVPFKEMLASEEVIRAGDYSLTHFNENWQLVPWSAKEIPSKENGLLEIYQENSQTKMRTTWHIKEDFFWADGKPLTAEDFVFAHKIYTDPNQEILDRTTVEKIEKMESMGEDKRTLVVTWKEPYAYYNNYSQHEALPKHILESLYNQAPDKLKKSSFSQTPVLAGAFSIKEWIAGSHIVAQRNTYAKGSVTPNLDEIIWRIIPQTNTLESNLVSGTIDAISNPGLDLEQALDFEKRYKGQYDFHYTEGLVWEHIDFNLENEILKDKNVRLALAYGADREGIANKLFHGKQAVAHATEPPKSVYHNANVKKYVFDPKIANELLEKSGWVKIAGKEIREKKGQELKLTFMTTSGNKGREQIQQLLQSQWRSIGINIEIKNQPAKVFFGETLRKRKYDALAMYAWVKDPVKVSDTTVRCDYIPSEKNNYQGQNLSGWCNPKVDALVKQATKELELDKRIKIAHQVEELFVEDLPSLPLFFRVDVSVTKKGLSGWSPTGTLQPVTWNAQKWSWN